MLRVSSGFQTLENIKSLGLRPRAFISFLVFETPMKHLHSFLKYYFKDTQRCKLKFAEFLNSKNESRRIEEIPPKELNKYISEFIVATRRKDGEDFESSSLRGLICSFNRHLKACSVIQTHQARV